MSETTRDPEPRDAVEHGGARLLVALGHRQNRDVLAEVLESRYHVRVTESVPDGAEFELCVADEASLAASRETLRAIRRRSEPVVRPCLLVTGRGVEAIEPAVWEVVDDSITTPVSLGELFPRVESLLRVHRLSVECSRQRRLQQVASTLSHDVRNPLAVARGNLDLARETGDLAHLDGARAALERIDNLVDDVLTLVREEHRPEDFTAVDLGAAGRDAWGECDLPGGELDVDVDDGFGLRADRSSLRELLANLYRNAVEHNDPPTVVTLGSLPDGFYVEDDGAGVAESERDAIFETGYSTRDGGTGLGLAIVDRVATTHGWDVSVTVGSAGGARFEVTGVTVQERSD